MYKIIFHFPPPFRFAPASPIIVCYLFLKLKTWHSFYLKTEVEIGNYPNLRLQVLLPISSSIYLHLSISHPQYLISPKNPFLSSFQLSFSTLTFPVHPPKKLPLIHFHPAPFLTYPQNLGARSPNLVYLHVLLKCSVIYRFIVALIALLLVGWLICRASGIGTGPTS